MSEGCPVLMTQKQQTANSKQQTANSKQQTANSKQQAGRVRVVWRER
jgi:hypothetical protein